MGRVQGRARRAGGGGGEEFGAVGGAAVGKDGLDGDAVGLVEGDGLVEGGQDAGSLLIWEERGEAQARVVIDGDVEALGAARRGRDGRGPGGALVGGRTPGWWKRPNFRMSRWRSSPGRRVLSGRRSAWEA